MSDASQRALDVVGVEDLSVIVASMRSSHVDLLSRLSGRT
jgi:hypothetical protein